MKRVVYAVLTASYVMFRCWHWRRLLLGW